MNNEVLKIKVTGQDIDNAMYCQMCFKFDDRARCAGLESTDIASPDAIAFLRQSKEGFLLTYGEETAVVRGSAADTLNSIFRRFLSKQSTPQQFSAAALPLIVELRGVAFKGKKSVHRIHQASAS
jgi:hypothetical protein